MLPKSARLNLSREFKHVASGSRRETPNLVVFIKEGSGEHPLVGIAVSKKSFALAVARNRAKRLVATAIQVLYPNLPNNLKLVIMPKAGINKTTVSKLQQELRQVLNVQETGHLNN